MNLKIKDVKFKISSEGVQYAEITVKGKTGSRTLPLIDSIPYIKEWILKHPEGQSPDSWLFISLSDKNNTFAQLSAFIKIRKWLDKYNRVKRLDSNFDSRIKDPLKNAQNKPYGPMRYQKIKFDSKYKDLYFLLVNNKIGGLVN